MLIVDAASVQVCQLEEQSLQLQHLFVHRVLHISPPQVFQLVMESVISFGSIQPTDLVGPIDIAGQTIPSNATTGIIAVTTSFRLKVTCANGGGTAYSNVISITVISPVISTTTPASRCGTGTLNLGATSVTSGAILNWYGSTNGGPLLVPEQYLLLR